MGQKKEASPSKQKKKKQGKKTYKAYVNDQQGLAIYDQKPIHSANMARATMTTPEYEDWLEQAEQDFALTQRKYYKKAKNKIPTAKYS